MPEDYGGAGFSHLKYVTAKRELPKLDPGIGLSMAAHNSLCTGHILLFGNEEQKQKYLPKLANCDCLGAWGLPSRIWDQMLPICVLWPKKGVTIL